MTSQITTPSAVNVLGVVICNKELAVLCMVIRKLNWNTAKTIIC